MDEATAKPWVMIAERLGIAAAMCVIMALFIWAVFLFGKAVATKVIDYLIERDRAFMGYVAKTIENSTAIATEQRRTHEFVTEHNRSQEIDEIHAVVVPTPRKVGAA